MVDTKREALIGEIHAAFQGVTRGGGVSLHEAREIDYHSSRAKREEARARDVEASWSEVTLEALLDNEKYLVFLDPLGLRYYLPALMTWYLRTDGQVGGEELLFALCLFPERKARSLSATQCKAVLSFLRYIGETQDEYRELVDGGCTSYWARFNDQSA